MKLFVGNGENMINREERLKVIETLKHKQELADKLEHNKKEVEKLQGMEKAATSIEKIEDLGRAIRKGQALVSIQTTAMTKLSAAKIARERDVTESAVNYQWRVLTGMGL